MAGTTISATNMQNAPLQRRYGMMPTASMQQVSATGGRYNPEAQNAILQREMENNKMRSVDVRTQALQRQAMEQEAATRAEELRLAALEQEREAALQKLTVETEASRIAGQKTLEDAYLKQGQNDLNVSAARREYAQNKYLADIQSREDMMQTAQDKALINSGVKLAGTALSTFGRPIAEGIDKLITPSAGEVPSGGGANIAVTPIPTVATQPAATEEVVPAGGTQGQVEAAPTTVAVQDTAPSANITDINTQQAGAALLKTEQAAANAETGSALVKDMGNQYNTAADVYGTSVEKVNSSAAAANKIGKNIETITAPAQKYYDEAMKYKGYAEGAETEDGFNWAKANFDANVAKLNEIQAAYEPLVGQYDAAKSIYNTDAGTAEDYFNKASGLYEDYAGQYGFMKDTLIPEYAKRYDVADTRVNQAYDSALGRETTPDISQVQAKSGFELPTLSGRSIVGSGLGALNAYQGLSTVLDPNSSDLRKLQGGIQTLSGATNIANALGANTGMVGDALGTVGQIINVGGNVYDIINGETTKDKVNAAANLVNTGVSAASQMYAGADALATGLANAGSTGATAGMSTLGSLASGFNIAMPYYALAKAGGMAINAITANNPDLIETPFGRLGGSLAEPLDVEGYWGRELAEHGVGTYNPENRHEGNPVISDTLNPVGGMMVTGQAGDYGGILDVNENKLMGDMVMLPSVGFATAGLPPLAGALAPLAPLALPALFGEGPLQGGSGWDTAGNAALSVFTGGLSNLFCFAKGTPILMENGDTIPVEQVRIFNKCMKGGTVTAIGEALSDEIYDYEGVEVTGSHAVYENRKWIRVRDSEKSIKVDITAPQRVYIINNMNHALVVNGIIFADYGEVTDSENMTAQDRLEYMNAHSKF